MVFYIQKCKFCWNDLLLNYCFFHKRKKVVELIVGGGMNKMATVGSIRIAALEALPVNN